MYDKHLTPEERVQIINTHLRRLAADAYSNFCIARGLAAQGHHDQAAKHTETVDSLNLAISALEVEAAQQNVTEVDHGHSHE